MHARQPPATMEQSIIRYLGKPRAARTLYDEKQDPEGLRSYPKDGHKDMTFAQLEERAKKRWARIRKEEDEAKKNPKPEPPDDGELPLDRVG